VVAANKLAEKGGIYTGMTLSTARTLVPQVRVLDRDLQAEQLAMEQLAIFATAWSPTVVTQYDQVLLLEIGSCLRLHHGLHELIKLVHKSLLSETFSCHIAVTPTPASAVLCARSGTDIYVTDRARLISRIGSMSIRNMELTSHQRALLTRLGVKCIGDLLRLPRDGLARRLGLELLQNLDRLIGKRPDPQSVFKPPLYFKMSIDFENEVFEVAQLLPEAKHLLAQLEQYLQRSSATIHYFEWHLQYGSHSYAQVVPVRLNRLRQRTTLLIGLSQLALEASFPTRGVTQFTLYAHPFSLAQVENMPLLPSTAPCELDLLLDLLYIRLGYHAVRGICCHPDHKPENAWISCEPGTHKPVLPPTVRPLWLFHSPRLLPIQNGQPSFHGPLKLSRHERIVANWWQEAPVRRDYYQAQSNQGMIWIFRDLKTGNWYIHGIF
jgi:protein ImuB